MTTLYSNVNVTNEGESKRSIANKKLSQSCFTNKNKSKPSIVNRPFLQNFYVNENELCSTKEDESKCAIKKEKDVNNEVACVVTNYLNVSNVFQCGRNNPDVLCERKCMANEDNE